MIIDEMMSLFLESRKRGLSGAKRKCSKKTVEIYERNIKIFRDYFQSEVGDGGVAKFESIRKMHMIQFLGWIDTRVEKKEWSQSTAIQLLGSMRTFFKWAEKD